MDVRTGWACAVAAAALLAFAVPECSCLTKKWQSRPTRSSTLARSLAARTDASCHRATFPSNENLSLFVNTELFVDSLVLPLNAEILLDNSGALTALAVQHSKTACPDSKEKSPATKQAATEPQWWHDPARWAAAADLHLALLHTERVPCPDDDVVLPALPELSLEADVAVASLNISSKNITASSFNHLLSTFTGKSIFRLGGHNIRIGTEHRCHSRIGCGCGNDRPEVRSLICSHVNCSDPICHDPVNAVGHCCPFCGGVVELVYDLGFELDPVRALVRDHYEREDSFAVAVSRTWQDRIQVAFLAAGPAASPAGGLANASSASAAALRESTLLHQHFSSNLKKYGILSSKLMQSGLLKSAIYAALGQAEESNTTTITLSVTLTIIILASFIAATAVFMRRCDRKTQLVAWIASLKSQGDTRHIIAAEMSGAEAPGFENPSYVDVTKTHSGNISIVSAGPFGEELRVNPTFQCDEGGPDCFVLQTRDTTTC